MDIETLEVQPLFVYFHCMEYFHWKIHLHSFAFFCLYLDPFSYNGHEKKIELMDCLQGVTFGTQLAQ